MPDLLVATSDKSFESDVLQSQLPVIVDFWAEWCRPCKMLMPILEEVMCKYSDRLKCFSLNIDENTNIASQYNVLSIPYLALFKLGKVVATKVGLQSKSQLIAFLDHSL